MIKNFKIFYVKQLSVIFFIATFFVLSSCEKGNEKSDPNSSAGTNSNQNQPAPDTSGTLALEIPTSPAGIMNMLDLSVSSSMSTPSTAALNPGELALSASLALADLTGQPCTTYAFPKDKASAADQSWSTTGPDFAAGRFYCLLAKNTYAPNSVQGAYYQDKGFLCLLEKSAIPFDGQSHTLLLDFTDKTCFSDEFRAHSFDPTEGVPSFPATVIASSPSVIAPNLWDKSVEITFPDGMGSMQMLFKSGDNKVSSAVYMNQNQKGTSAYAMTLDLKAGRLLIDRRGLTYQTGNPTRRSYRLLIEGDVDSKGVFTRVGSYQGIDIDSYTYTDTANNMEKISSQLHSIRGLDSKGFKTQSRGCNNCTNIFDITNYSVNSASSRCYPGSNGANTCLDINPILFDTSEDLKIIPDNTRIDFIPFDEWIKRGPLNYLEIKSAQVQ